MGTDIQTDVVVLGAGPGGYTAAFRAADLGKKVVLVERYHQLGGVCLNVGCIPSKALLHAAKLIEEAQVFAERGIRFERPNVDVAQLRKWVERVIHRLTTGLSGLSKQRKVQVVQGVAQFLSDKAVLVEGQAGVQTIRFEHAIIAVGSRPIALPFLPADHRIMDSTAALELTDIPERLLVIGGGIIGLEMATVYHALGSKISVVELTEGLLPGVDRDIVLPLQKRLQKRYEHIWLNTKVVGVEAKPDGIWVRFEGAQAPTESVRFDRVLSSVGRVPNGGQLSAEKAGVSVDARGFIPVDKQQRTNIPHILAIGDVAGGGDPMVAHKAIAQGRVAAEVIDGQKHFFEPRCIPSVAYTDPEVAWVGMTETEAKKLNIAYGKGSFPWAANGRSLTLGRDEGITKMLFDKKTHRVMGAGIVGPHAGDLIAEVALSIEMGCEAGDLALTIHPHPTLAETLVSAAEVFDGTVTDL